MKIFVVIWPKKTLGHIKYKSKIDLFFSKNQNFDPKHKIPKNQWEKLNRFYYCQISKFGFFKSALLLLDRFWTNLKICLQFFLLKSLQKTCLYIHWKLQRNPSAGKGLNFFFDLMDLTIWDFWQTPARVRWGQKLNRSSTGT